MYTKKDLRKFLVNSCLGARFTKFSFVSAERFKIELKCKVEAAQTGDQYAQYMQEWIKKFSLFTTTTWIVRSTFAKLKRLVFRKTYNCSRSGFNKKKKPDIDCESRNQECRAKIDFRIKFINRNTIKNDVFLKDGLNLTISIDFHHSHLVRTPESYNLLRHSEDVDAVFLKYFDTGCSTTAAKAYHELTLMDKYGENCPEVFHNATMNPTLRHLSYLLNRKRKECESLPSFTQLMEERKLKDIGVDLVFASDQNMTVIITPAMKRVIAAVGAKRVIVDKSEVPYRLMVTYFLVPTKIGALPIACVIHRNKGSFNEYMPSAISNLEMETGIAFNPEVCMLSNFEEQSSWDLFSECKKYSSRYALCGEAWRLLNDDDSEVDRHKRHSVMVAINNLIHAESLEVAEKIYAELKENKKANTSALLIGHLDNLWESKEQWLVEGEHDANSNLVDMSIRFLKEFLLRKCKTFTVSLMVDVVTNILEKHYKRILMSYVKNTNKIATYTKFLEKSNIVLNCGLDLYRISAEEYKIDLHCKPKKSLHFRTDTMCCNCNHGKRGAFCEHLCGIINKEHSESMRSTTLDEEEVRLFSNIAGDDVEDEIKPEVNDVNDTEELDEGEADTVSDDNEDKDETNEDNLDKSSVTSDKLEGDNLYMQVKVEGEEYFDPLEEEEAEINRIILTQNNASENDNRFASTSRQPDMKLKYEGALKAVNDEFRRLNCYFSENPNATNLATMGELVGELRKIRPVQSINLDNMHITLNQNRKRKLDE